MHRKKLKPSELNRLSVDENNNASKIPVIVILEDIRSLMNIGSVFRTADAFRVEKIILCGITAKPPHREIHKTALGATESVDWIYYKDTISALHELKDEGYQIFALEQTHHSLSILDMPFLNCKKVAFVFGNEVNGVTDNALAICDEVVEIPQFGTKHSLNISVCAGIVLWEALKVFKKEL